MNRSLSVGRACADQHEDDEILHPILVRAAILADDEQLANRKLLNAMLPGQAQSRRNMKYHWYGADTILCPVTDVSVGQYALDLCRPF